jgi:hypothetical protein
MRLQSDTPNKAQSLGVTSQIELISPTTSSYKTRLLRRTVQSYSQISRFSEVNEGVSAIVSRGKFWQETKQIASRLPTTRMRI